MVLAVFGVVGGVVLWRLEALGAAQALWSIGGVFALVYYTVRPLRRPLYNVWMGLTRPIGWAVSHLVLAVVFYALITPIGSVMRLFGRDALERRFDPAAQSYWAARDPGDDTARYFRQS
jgi:hypothetical protein